MIFIIRYKIATMTAHQFYKQTLMLLTLEVADETATALLNPFLVVAV